MTKLTQQLLTILVAILVAQQSARAGIVVHGTRGAISAQYTGDDNVTGPLRSASGPLNVTLPSGPLLNQNGKAVGTAEGSATYAASSSFAEATTSLTLTDTGTPNTAHSNDVGLSMMSVGASISLSIFPDGKNYYVSGGFSYSGYVAPGDTIQIVVGSVYVFDFGSGPGNEGIVTNGDNGVTFTSGYFHSSVIQAPIELYGGFLSDVKEINCGIDVYIHRSGAEDPTRRSYVTVDPSVGIANSALAFSTPEPASVAMLGIGLAGLLGYARLRPRRPTVLAAMGPSTKSA